MDAPSPSALQALRLALTDYDRAELGRLNATADALRSAARACGWAWGMKEPLRQWAANRLTGEDRADPAP